MEAELKRAEEAKEAGFEYIMAGAGNANDSGDAWKDSLAPPPPGLDRRVMNNSAMVTYVYPGKKVRPEDVPYPRQNTWWEEAVALATMLFVFGAGFWVPITFFASIYYMVTQQSKIAVLVFAFYLMQLIIPQGKSWPAWQNWFVFDTWRRHFGLRIIVPPLPFCEKNKHYLFAHFPHATFPMACWLTMPLCGHPATGIPAPATGAIASVLLQLPLAKHMFGWMNCYPADRKVVMRLLKYSSVGLIPEGVAGIFQGANRDKEAIYIKDRQGFVKVAIQAGTDIVPVYHLGNSQMLSFKGFPELSRKLRSSLGIFWGRYGLPLPHQHDIISVAAPPVTVKQNDHPTDEEVAETHARVVKALQTSFETHKHLLPGWEHKELHLV